jgi:uncharacterized protein
VRLPTRLSSLLSIDDIDFTDDVEGGFMNRWLAIVLLSVAACTEASKAEKPPAQAGALCTDAWYRSVEEEVPTGDGHGHGPDIGSDEWKSVVEFKLGVRGKPDLPKRESEAWCRYIDQIIRTLRTPPTDSGETGRTARGTSPSFRCSGVAAGSVEAMICGDEELSALDRKLSAVFAAASRKAVNQHPPLLAAEQRGWIKGRNECWKVSDRRTCVKTEYERRIAELQASYRLVSNSGPVRFICDGNPSNEVVATFFQTEPASLIAERGDRVSVMYLQPSASGSRYLGRNESLWEHQGEALITWGHGAPEMRCARAR